MRSTTIQTSKSGDIYKTRVNRIQECGAQEMYDILDIQVKINRNIMKIENQK